MRRTHLGRLLLVWSWPNQGNHVRFPSINPLPVCSCQTGTPKIRNSVVCRHLDLPKLVHLSGQWCCGASALFVGTTRRQFGVLNSWCHSWGPRPNLSVPGRVRRPCFSPGTTLRTTSHGCSNLGPWVWHKCVPTFRPTGVSLVVTGDRRCLSILQVRTFARTGVLSASETCHCSLQPRSPAQITFLS